jgi:phenylpropionate dioxygenase-like ring-hydroxylating dioxygenase large terminal subunit
MRDFKNAATSRMRWATRSGEGVLGRHGDQSVDDATQDLPAEKRPSIGDLKAEWRIGEFGLPVARYIDKSFAALEAERLWTRTWQMACRVEQLRSPGDYVVYDILDQSIVVVLTQDGAIKAYHNVCPHRATALAVGSGRFQLNAIVCPFHGWKWDLDGTNTFVLDRPEFMNGCLSDDYLHLHEVQVGIALGGVWINMDPEAGSLEDHLAPVMHLLGPLMLDEMKFLWHKSVVVNANWKIAQEAFLESYHVPQTHPQLLSPRAGGRFGNYYYDAYRNGHGLHYPVDQPGMMGDSSAGATVLSQADQANEMLRGLTKIAEGLDCLVLEEDLAIAKSMRHRALGEGETIISGFRRALHDHYAAQGRSIPAASALAKVTDIFVFPNITILPTFGNVLMYRSRPLKGNDPNWCSFELIALRTYAKGDVVPAWEVEECTNISDGTHFKLIPRQDFDNIPRQQRGLHSRAIKEIILSGRQEIVIRNMHAELDRYLDT